MSFCHCDIGVIDEPVEIYYPALRFKRYKFPDRYCFIGRGKYPSPARAPPERSRKFERGIMGINFDLAFYV